MKTPLACYMHFVTEALRGGNPDTFFRLNRSEITVVARQLRKVIPTTVMPTLYRGILLDPQKHTGHVCPLDHVTYVSFSEDRHVAEVFADMDHDMASLYRQIYPNHEGYIIRHELQEEDVILFHHSWAEPLHLEFYFGDKVRNVLEQKEVMLLNRGLPMLVRRFPRGTSNHDLGRNWL